MFTKSIWNSYSAETNFPVLNKIISVDVAIIGGGITGVTTALLLKRMGLQVVVLEAKKVGKGTTGHSTGNLYSIIDQLLSPIISKYDRATLLKVIQSRTEAFELIKQNIKQFNLDCDYLEQPMHFIEDVGLANLEKEYVTASESGMNVEEIEYQQILFENYHGFTLKNQATFNPLRYVQELALKVEGENCKIYENTRVTEVLEGKDEVLVNTTSGKVLAKHVLHATHTPKGLEVQYHTTLGPYREYGVAVKLRSGAYPQGICWAYHKNQKYSIRSYTRNGESFLLCVGSPHKVGQAKDNLQHIQELLKFLEQKYIIEEVTHKWGGQHYKPADLLPYIGKKNQNSRQYVATGFATDGLVYGTLSAILIADEITGKQNPYAELFKASRHQPLKAATEFLKENLDVAVEFVKGWLQTHGKEINEVLPGEARILQIEEHKAAVYRDKAGELFIKSAVCPHMGCIVHWNNAEETWDCPCHGSRFDHTGEVLEGPAFDPLKNIGRPE